MFISSLHIGSLWKMGWIWGIPISNWESDLGTSRWSSLCPGSFSLSLDSHSWFMRFHVYVRNQTSMILLTKLSFFYHLFIFHKVFPPNQLEGSFAFPPFSGPLTTLGTLRSAEGSKISEKWTWTDGFAGILVSVSLQSMGGNAPYNILIYILIERERETKMYTCITISVWDRDQSHWNIKHSENYIMKNSISTNLIEDSKFRAAASRIPTQRCSSPNWKNKAFEDAWKRDGDCPSKKTESRSFMHLQKKGLVLLN